MKKHRAFTMLELVFILVILSILAAVGIPKISASRDDAKLVSLKSDINMLRTSFPAYFIAQGKGSFVDSVLLSSQNWDISNFRISSTIKDANSSPCIVVRLLKDDNIEATMEADVSFMELSTNSVKNNNGNTCERLLYQIGLDSSNPIKITLLSSSIVF